MRRPARTAVAITAGAPGVWLTGLRIKKSEKDIRANTSIDQIMAQRIGKLTPFPLLELISDGSRKTGNCDSGYSCEMRTFHGGRRRRRILPSRIHAWCLSDCSALELRRSPASLAERRAKRRSVLDFVLDDAKQMTLDLGVNDRRKLDEYLYSVLPRSNVAFRTLNSSVMCRIQESRHPSGMPCDFKERIDVMLEMMALTFITDSTVHQHAHSGPRRRRTCLRVAWTNGWSPFDVTLQEQRKPHRQYARAKSTVVGGH